MIDRLGEGAGSLLYVVSAPKTQQLYALKHVLPTTDKEQRFVEQLQNEFEVSKQFTHPGLRRSVDMQIKKKLFGGVTEAALVMELVDGTSLDRHHPVAVPDMVDVFIDVASALSGLHELRLVHCDLKPNNILLRPGGGLKLIDFGQTCKIGTVKQRVQGTPDYIAPEQVRLKSVGVFTDVYNLGATLYWSLTGRRIPTMMTVEKSERDIVRQQQFPRPQELNAEVPEPLSELVMHCVRVHRPDRPQTMTEVIARLKPFATSSVG